MSTHNRPKTSGTDASTSKIIGTDAPVTEIKPALAHTTTLTPELFEQLYLNPKTDVTGRLRHTFANPTPVAIAGFLLCTTPLSMILLGWRGAGQLGAANIGSYFYFGGLLLLLGGIGEWILGNSFSTVVFMTFGSFWFTFGTTLLPGSGASNYYPQPQASSDPSLPASLSSAEFCSTFAFFLTAMVLLCTVYLIASIRTNIVFLLIFVFLVPCFSCLAAAFWAEASGHVGRSLILQHVGAALLLIISLLGWYEFLAMVLLSVDFPFVLPIGDLSTRVPTSSGKTTRRNIEHET